MHIESNFTFLFFQIMVIFSCEFFLMKLGKKLLSALAGTDATKDYDKYMHSKKWVLELPSCHYVGLFDGPNVGKPEKVKKQKPAEGG